MNTRKFITILCISSLLVACEDDISSELDPIKEEDTSAPNELDLIFTTDVHGDFLTREPFFSP